MISSRPRILRRGNPLAAGGRFRCDNLHSGVGRNTQSGKGKRLTSWEYIGNLQSKNSVLIRLYSAVGSWVLLGKTSIKGRDASPNKPFQMEAPHFALQTRSLKFGLVSQMKTLRP